MNVKQRFSQSVAFPLALVMLPMASVSAQSGAEIMNRAMAAQTERLAGVENVTITQNTMGMSVVMYMEKKDLGGVPTLFPVSVSTGGMVTPMPQEETAGDWTTPFQKQWAERTRVEGDEELDGRRVKVLAIDDFSDLDLPGLPGGGENEGFEPKSLRFWLDEGDMVMRKMEMEAEVRRDDGGLAPVQITMFMEDYREVDGYLHPFSTRMISKGLMEAADVDQAELQAQLAELKARMADMPEAQRAMMEGMLNSQIEAMEGMLGSGEGMEITMTVTDLKINAGPPGGG